MREDAFYDEVARELEANALVPGVWMKALADAQGDMDRARALYIRYRVTQLAEERDRLHGEEKRRKAKALRERMSSRAKSMAFYALAAISALVAALLLLSAVMVAFDGASDGGQGGGIWGGLFGAAMLGLVAWGALRAAED